MPLRPQTPRRSDPRAHLPIGVLSSLLGLVALALLMLPVCARGASIELRAGKTLSGSIDIANSGIPICIYHPGGVLRNAVR